jgi:hypothetical protein
MFDLQDLLWKNDNVVYLSCPVLIKPQFLYKFLKFSPEKYPFIIVSIVTLPMTIILSLSFVYLARKVKVLEKYLL